MGACRDCQWWESGYDPTDPLDNLAPAYPGWGLCESIVGYRTTDRGFAIILTARCLNEDCSEIAEEPEDVQAHLWTAPDFGCNQFAPREGR